MAYVMAENGVRIWRKWLEPGNYLPWVSLIVKFHGKSGFKKESSNFDENGESSQKLPEG